MTQIIRNTKYIYVYDYICREIATITYRSGPEWDRRFNRDRIDTTCPPTLCPTFSIESYLEHQGESFSTKYDPNSLLYISKVSICYLKERKLRSYFYFVYLSKIFYGRLIGYR